MKNNFFSLFFLLIGLCTHAQVEVDIRGIILDDKGAPIEGVSVYLEQTSLGAISDASGNYVITQIIPGSYNLTAQSLGFTTKTKYNIIVKSKGNPSFDFVLEESNLELETVVINNENKIKRSVETPLSTQSLSAVEIATYPGGNNDVVQVAQSLPGVSPSIGGFRNDLIIRGGAPNETVYYLDGMEVPNINHFATQGSAGGPVGLLNISFINDVTLSTSAFGAEYDNPLSGVLQFSQRDGNRYESNTNIRISATDAAFTFEGPLFKANAEESKTSMIFSVRRSYLQALFKLIGLPIRPDYWDYQYKLSHKIDNYNDLYFMGLGSIDDFTVERPDEYDEIAEAVLEQAPYIEQRTNSVGLTWRRRFKDGSGFMQNTLSTNRLKNIYTTYQIPETRTGIIFRNDAVESEIKLRHKTTKFIGNWKLSGGFNIQHSDYSNDTKNNVDNIFYSSDINFQKFGLFASASRSYLNNKLSMSLGFRMDDDNFTTQSNLLKTFSPRISLSYEMINNWFASASVGRYYKLPPYTILGFRDNSNILLNDNIEYTRSDHYVAGIQYVPNPSARISIEGFYKRYNNYPVSIIDGISLANKGADFEVLGNEDITAIGKGKTYGLEFQYQQKLRNNFYSIFSYTYFFSKFSGLDSSEFKPSVWDSRHLISFVGGYKLKKNWEISSRYRFAGRTPYVPADLDQTLITYPEISLNYNRLGEEKIDVFSQLDARVDKKWNYKKWSLNIFLEVQNLLMQSIPTPPEYGLARDNLGDLITPRSLTELDQDTDTPIPSIGIVIDF
jgi:outer membrane receptor for ferrienterochelin and colicin